MRASKSTPIGGVSQHQTIDLAQFRPGVRFGTIRGAQSPLTGRPFFEQRTERARVAPSEVCFGPFRLLPSQFLLLEGDKPVPLGSRALEVLIVLLERVGQLVRPPSLGSDPRRRRRANSPVFSVPRLDFSRTRTSKILATNSSR